MSNPRIEILQFVQHILLVSFDQEWKIALISASVHEAENPKAKDSYQPEYLSSFVVVTAQFRADVGISMTDMQRSSSLVTSRYTFPAQRTNCGTACPKGTCALGRKIEGVQSYM